MCRDLKNCDLKIQHCPEDSKEICRFGECQKHCAGDNQCTDKEKCYKDYCATACVEDRYNLIDHGHRKWIFLCILLKAFDHKKIGKQKAGNFKT